MVPPSCGGFFHGGYCMKAVINFSEVFVEDIVHLHGNLYRVRKDAIRMARAGINVEDGKLIYGNPRWFINKNGEFEARGIDDLPKMEELKNSIKNIGLDNPLRIRPIINEDEQTLEIVNGERRFRCIDELCIENEVCHDSSGEKRPATEIYEWIECRIEELDDKSALEIALKTNETSEIIGDIANIQVVKVLREAGYDDQDILLATGKSISWLRETDRINSLDKTCLESFQKDHITRKAALQLALIENAEERISVLEKIVNIAKNRHFSKIQELDKKVQEAEDDEIINSSALEVAQSIGDEDQAEELIEASRKSKKKAEKAREEKEKISSKSPKADARDIKKVKTKPLSATKIKSLYIRQIQEVIDSEGFDEDGDTLGIDVTFLSSVLGVLQSIVEGNPEVIEVLQSYFPLEMEELLEETEETEENSLEDEDEDEDEKYYLNDDYDEEDTPAELENEFNNSIDDHDDDDDN